MPISLRLPAELETQITGFGVRLGLSKSAVIVRSIQEFLARNAQPTSLQIYEDAMRLTPNPRDAIKSDKQSEAAEQRAHKRQTRTAIRSKHAERSARALQAPLKPTRKVSKPA